MITSSIVLDPAYVFLTFSPNEDSDSVMIKIEECYGDMDLTKNNTSDSHIFPDANCSIFIKLNDNT